MQKIEIIGNLGADCAIRNGADGKQYNAFQVAVTEGQVTNWYGVIMQRRERMEAYLIKGAKVFLRGDLSVKVNTLRDGRQVVDLDIFAKEIELVGGKMNEENPL